MKMDRLLLKIYFPVIVAVFAGLPFVQAQVRLLDKKLLRVKSDKILDDSIIYHRVRVDESGNILPWYSPDPGLSYDHNLRLVWRFWDNMELDSNGVKYYMNHQVWRPNHDRRGIGGDQVMMALSSWDLLYNYLGDPAIIENMKYQADYYLAHSLSDSNALWPNLPFPYNMKIESGIYDGDMRAVKGVLQPDKAGSLGFELVHLYKKTGDRKYLEAAVKIANTLSKLVKPGDADHSPWPFKVNAVTGEIADLGKNDLFKENVKAGYTSNWTGALGLFKELISLQQGNQSAYQHAFDLTMNWMLKYPLKTNKWGPFFEDVYGFSNTQINAVTFAMYLMLHPETDPGWKQDVISIFNWVHSVLGNKEFEKYGVLVTNEQTVYLVPGNSHSSRQASMELLYWSLTGDDQLNRNAIRELNWATYTVDSTGKNYYPRDDIWMTDGYGDYVRHYLRAMAAAPQLAPAGADHLLKSSSIVQMISYTPDSIRYRVFDIHSGELFRLSGKPVKIFIDSKNVSETKSIGKPGWFWQALDTGGILTINHHTGSDILIVKR